MWVKNVENMGNVGGMMGNRGRKMGNVGVFQ
jgi:hypothetical protein